MIIRKDGLIFDVGTEPAPNQIIYDKKEKFFKILLNNTIKIFGDIKRFNIVVFSDVTNEFTQYEDYYLYLGGSFFNVGGKDTLDHKHDVINLYQGHCDRIPNYLYSRRVLVDDFSSVEAVPRRVYIGLKKEVINITTHSTLPPGSLLLSTEDLSSSLKGLPFKSYSNNRYVYITSNSNEIGVEGGSTSHTHDFKFSCGSVKPISNWYCGSVSCDTKLSSVKNDYNALSFYSYLYTGTKYLPERDPLPINSIILTTSPNIPPNYIKLDVEGLIYIKSNNFLHTEGSETHFHTISLRNVCVKYYDICYERGSGVEIPYAGVYNTTSDTHMPPYKEFHLIKRIS